jgi:hypothetical protein
MNKAALLRALDNWISQRPGLDPRDYIRAWNDREGLSTYRAEARSITKDLHHARALLRYVGYRDSITAEDILRASRDAFSGRLTIVPLNDGEGFSVQYCVGQYWPTEYRRAACAVLASAIWDRIREDLPPEIEHKGDAIRKAARRELGAGLSRRWFH